MIVIKVADIPVGIDNRYSQVAVLCKDYLTDEEPVFSVRALDSDIEKEREVSDAEYSDAYLESVVVYRLIAEHLPKYGAIVFHGAVLALNGSAYAFTARSGVGKTTHTRLWLDEIDGSYYLNGDKPIIRLIDGVPYAYGTPWRGKEGYGVNECAPLVSVALLERGERNSAVSIESNLATMRFIKQIYIPKNPSTAALAMRVADRIISSVRFVELRCNMDPEAAHVAYREMTKQ